MNQNKPKCNLIVAVGENGEIGIGNELLGHFPTDMAHFKEKTSGNVVVMGRKTFESLRIKPLPRRENIVITRDLDFHFSGVEVVHSIEDAIRKAFELADGKCDIFIIGGAEIYDAFLKSKWVDRIFLTRFHKTFAQADAFIELPNDWQVVEKISVFADGIDMDFITLECVNKSL